MAVVVIALRRRHICIVVEKAPPFRRLLEGAHAGGAIEDADVEGREVPVMPCIESIERAPGLERAGVRKRVEQGLQRSKTREGRN